MSKQRRTAIILILCLISSIVAIWGVWFALQSSFASDPMPTLAHIAEASPVTVIEIQPSDVNETESTNVTIDTTLHNIESQQIEPPSEAVPEQFILEFADDMTADMATAYLESTGVRVVEIIPELNRIVVISTAESLTTLVSDTFVSAEPDNYVTALLSLPPSDPLYEDQWNLQMISAPQAWAELPESIPQIRIAVIDSGVCFDHPDMQAIYTDFQHDYVDDDDVPFDDYGHGCSVTGVIASQNNNIDIIGIAPFAEIMPLRVLDDNGIGAYSDVAQAIVDATNHGAHIINLSLGGYQSSNTLKSAIDYALANDVYVVAATGNDGQSTPLYPAYYDGVIAVGSVNSTGSVSSFSNLGEDSLAPGEQILVPLLDDSYGYATGTSLASPHVAGVIALELARGREPIIYGGLISVSSDDTPASEPTPIATETPEFITINGRTIPYVATPATIKTDRWVVRLTDNTNADNLASQLGFQNLGQVGNLSDYYVFARLGTGESETQALSASQALSTSPLVLEYEQEETLYRELRLIPADPLVDDQWHLINTGQSSGTADYDINVEDAWINGYDGSGVTIAIVDTGMEYTHPDFTAKYVPAASYDFNGSDVNSTIDEDNDPLPEIPEEAHGTSVGGVAAADDDGSKCGVGVAYNANLSSLRLIANGHTFTDSQEAGAFGFANQVNDIYNNSWGIPDVGFLFGGPGTMAKVALEDGILNGRGSLGSIFVFSNGNGDGAPYYDHSNADGYANSRYTIAVGATDDNGEKAYYSEIGTNLLVNAPGGPTSTIDPANEPKWIVTTDRTGTAGYNNAMGFSEDCTDGFSGTSAAAPSVSGVVALMLEANPNLTWRDVQHILVESSYKNDPTHDSWDTNNAGYNYSIYYGFGTVDATEAVNLATTWTSVGEEVTASNFGPFDTSDIPDGLADRDTTDIPDPGELNYASFYFPENIQIESVIARIHADHPWRGDLMMELTSPNGTTSYIYPTRKNDFIDFNGILEPSSMEFWGEMSAGVWTLAVADGWAGDVGKVYGITLHVYGTQGPPSEVGWRVGHTDGFLYAAYDFETNDIADTIILTNGVEYIFDEAVFTSSNGYALPILFEDLTIDGNGAIVKRSDKAGTENFRFMHTSTLGHLTINDVTFENFYGNGYPDDNGGIFHNLGTLIINDSTLDKGTSDEYGGAIYNRGDLTINNTYIRGDAVRGGGIYQDQGTLTITDSILRGSAIGGGLYVDDGTVTIMDSEFQFGSGIGGGIYLSGGDTILTDVRFYQNTSPGNGGAILYNNNGATVAMTNVEFEENTAQSYGGAILFANAPADFVYINGATFIGNQQNSITQPNDFIGGGAVAILGSNPGAKEIFISDATFEDNTANNFGGAILLDDVGRLVLNNVSFTLNSAQKTGGAIAQSLGNISGTDVIFKDNVGHVSGGAISLPEAQGGLLVLNRAILTGNSAPLGFGGALHLDGNQGVYLINTTITDNSAAFHGGAIYFSQLNDLYISHSTITNNVADTGNTDSWGGGGIWNANPVEASQRRIYLHNSILYDNVDTSATTDFSPDCYGWIRETGINIIKDTTGCSLVGPGTFVTDDPLLGPLQDNGGFAETRAIPDTSPAYNTATDCTQVDSDDRVYEPLTEDMRGIARPKGAECDIGAFELTLGFPDDPTNLAVTGISYTEAQLTWTDNSGDETAYLVERASVGGNDWVQIAEVDANVVSYFDSSLLCDSSFDYRIRAYRFGDNRYSENYTAVVTGGPWLCQPDTPTNVNVTTVLYQEALDISWQDTNDDESEFRILRSITNTGGFVQVGTTGVDITTYNDTDTLLDCYTEYFYQIQVYRTIDGQLSELSDIASGQTSCSTVNTPDSLTANGTEDVMNLNWNDNSPDETSFEIQRAISGSGSWSTIGTISANITEYIDIITTCGSAYDYRVRAYRAGDTRFSNFSNISSATQDCAPPPAPSDLTLLALQLTNDIQLDWLDNSTTETDFYVDRSLDGISGWAQVGTVTENVITYTDTDASLSCYTPYYYQVRAYRGDDGVYSDYSNIINISTWCDPDLVASQEFTVDESTSDISGVVGFPAPSCAPNVSHAYVWEFPTSAPDMLSLTTFGSSFDTVISIWSFDGSSLVELACNDNAAMDGTSALAKSFAGGSRHMVIVGGKNQANGTITLNSSLIAAPTATLIPTHTLVPTQTQTPDLTTVGLYKDSMWLFRETNSSGTTDHVLRFGGNLSSGWYPLVGDFDGNGIDGIGLYKNGRWLLSDDIAYSFIFGSSESGWQPVVGDWNGDGADGVGLYKDGIWMLKNNPSTGDADYTFRFNVTGTLSGKAIAGDWHGESKDRVGLYEDGTWFLSYGNQTSTNAKIFDFGPNDGSWLPVTGDWDKDGNDTIGVYKDGGWRLRNTNSRGNPDLGFTYGLIDAVPIAGYHGDLSALVLHEPSPTPTLTFTPSNTPGPLPTHITLTPNPTDGPSPTSTEIINTHTPIPTDTPFPTFTLPPSATPILGSSATYTPTSTYTLTPSHTPTPPSSTPTG